MLATISAAVALPSTATAQRVVPPGNSAVNQYTETYPTAGGGATTNETSGSSPAKALGKRNARELEALGEEGQEAAALAAATAPAPVSTGNGGASKAGGGSNLDQPSGSSGLSEVLGQATGTSSDGRMGLLLPTIILVTVVLSAVYAWRRRHPGSQA